MHTGPQYTSPQPFSPGGGGGRGNALLVGGIAFAVVFLLIVGGTVGYLVLRSGGDSGAGDQTSSPTESGTATESVTDTDSSSASPTNVEEERCWRPDSAERTSSNPSGKLRGGGLQFIPPPAFDGRLSPSGLSYMNDIQSAQAIVPGSDGWASTMTVGAVEWQPGIEYPGAEVASQRILTCYFSASVWGDTQGRSLDDQVTQPVTIAGLSGYRTTATVNFAKIDVPGTTATDVAVVVLDTPQGPSAFVQDTAVGITAHEEAAGEGYESLTGIG